MRQNIEQSINYEDLEALYQGKYEKYEEKKKNLTKITLEKILPNVRPPSAAAQPFAAAQPSPA